MNATSSAKKGPRIAIYTIKDEENLAVYDRIGPHRKLYRGRSGQQYTLARVPTPSGDVTVALFKGVLQGQREAQTLISRAVSDISPDWVIVVGIGGGASNSDLTIGDVVVAAEVLDFTYEMKQDAREPALHPRTVPLHRLAHALVAMLPIATRQISHWSTEDAVGRKPPPPQLAQIKHDVPANFGSHRGLVGGSSGGSGATATGNVVAAAA